MACCSNYRRWVGWLSNVVVGIGMLLAAPGAGVIEVGNWIERKWGHPS